jgi:hypothetical protein
MKTDRLFIDRALHCVLAVLFQHAIDHVLLDILQVACSYVWRKAKLSLKRATFEEGCEQASSERTRATGAEVVWATRFFEHPQARAERHEGCA